MNQYLGGLSVGLAGQLLGQYPPTLKQRLETAVLQAEERLRAVKEAKELFDKNPGIEKLLDIMLQKGLF